MIKSAVSPAPVAAAAQSASPLPTPDLPVVPPGTLFHRFANGLELILRPDHSAPVVSAQAWCRAGSIDEGQWLGAGLSHVLEHMLFKGTSTRGSGRIDQEVQAAGGYSQADVTQVAKVFTGWTINQPYRGGDFQFDERRHEPSSKTVLGQTIRENGMNEYRGSRDWPIAVVESSNLVQALEAFENGNENVVAFLTEASGGSRWSNWRRRRTNGSASG